MASKICTRQYLVVCNALYYDLAYVAARLVNGAVVSCYCSVASNTYYSFTNFSDLESPTALVVTLGLLVYINRLCLNGTILFRSVKLLQYGIACADSWRDWRNDYCNYCTSVVRALRQTTAT